jgi:hypothetical protein
MLPPGGYPEAVASNTRATDSRDLGGPLKPWQRVGREIDLPVGTAVWVLIAHVLTILVPLLLVAAVAEHDTYLDTVLDRPALLYVSAGLFIVGSVCESAQNTLDRWYLTGTPPSLLDMLFNSLIVLALAFQVLAAVGDVGWVWPAALVIAALFPVAYLMGWPTPPIQAVLGLAAAVLIYQALDQPVVFFSLVTVFFTLYFLDILIKTHQQVMHGFTTLVNAFSVVALVAAISWAATGQQGWSWVIVIAVAVLAIGAAVVVRPWLLRLPPTLRRSEPAG